MVFHSVIGKEHEIVFPFPQVDDPLIEMPNWLRKTVYGGNFTDSWGLAKDPPYLKLNGIMKASKEYSFFQTVANPQAIKTIGESDIAKKFDLRDEDFYFGQELMDCYLASLSDIAKQRGIQHWQYPRVDSSHGRGNIGTRVFVHWPIVHAVDAQREEDYKNIISKIAGSSLIPNDPNTNRHFNLQAKILMESEICPFMKVGPSIRRNGVDIHNQGQPFQLYRFVYSSETFDPSTED